MPLAVTLCYLRNQHGNWDPATSWVYQEIGILCTKIPGTKAIIIDIWLLDQCCPTQLAGSPCTTNSLLLGSSNIQYATSEDLQVTNLFHLLSYLAEL